MRVKIPVLLTLGILATMFVIGLGVGLINPSMAMSWRDGLSVLFAVGVSSFVFALVLENQFDP